MKKTTISIIRCVRCSGAGKILAGCAVCPECDGAGAFQEQGGRRAPYREPPLTKKTIREAMAHDLGRQPNPELDPEKKGQKGSAVRPEE